MTSYAFPFLYKSSAAGAALQYVLYRTLTILPSDFIKRIFETKVVKVDNWLCRERGERLTKEFDRQLCELKKGVSSQTEEYVSFEIDKFQAWAEDQVYSLENDVISLRKEDQSLKRQIRKERNSSVKLDLQEREAKIARLLRQKQRQLFDMEDEYTAKVDHMTSELRISMINEYDVSPFVKFKWHIL